MVAMEAKVRAMFDFGRGRWRMAMVDGRSMVDGVNTMEIGVWYVLWLLLKLRAPTLRSLCRNRFT